MSLLMQQQKGFSAEEQVSKNISSEIGKDRRQGRGCWVETVNSFLIWAKGATVCLFFPFILSIPHSCEVEHLV